MPISSRTMAPSSPQPDMRITMHASPIQPPPSSDIRLGSSYCDRVPDSTPPSSPPNAEAAMNREPIDRSEARRLRDEERLREIYGEDDPHLTPYPQTSSQHRPPSPTSSLRAEPTTSGPRHPDSYIPPPTPKSPSEEAYERREARESQKKPYQTASLPELLLEVVKVLMRDPKNIAIVALGILAMFLMSRPPQAQFPQQTMVRYEPEIEPIVANQVPVMDTAQLADVEMPTTVSSIADAVESAGIGLETEDPPLREPPREKERKIVRVVETVTETISPEPTAETVYETETIKVTVSASPSCLRLSRTQPGADRE